MEYIYGFTSDNKKVVIGTIEEESQGGYSLAFPANIEANSNFGIIVNFYDGSQTEYSRAELAGATLSHVVSFRSYSINSPEGYYYMTYPVTANEQFNYTYEDNRSGSAVSGTGTSVTPSRTFNLIITLLSNTTLTLI